MLHRYLQAARKAVLVETVLRPGACVTDPSRILNRWQ